MIKCITIENYMAHSLTVLELSPGVTVITGPNNTGKSAIVEAFRAIAQNPPYRHAIRHGARNAVVRVELDSGEIIEWDRSQKTVLYRLYRPEENGAPDADNPEVYAKLTSRKPPDDVRTLLRLDLVETETGPVDIHIGNQRYPIFLLDQAGSQAASFFAASTEAEYLLRMQQALKRRSDEAKSKRRELTRECAEAERDLEHFRQLDPVETILLEAEALFATTEENRKAIPALEAFLETLSGTTARHRGKVRSGSVLEVLSSPPELYRVGPQEGLLQEMELTESRLHLRRAGTSILSPLRTPPVVLEVPELEELIVHLDRTVRAHALAFERTRELHRVCAPPPMHETAAIECVCEDLRTVTCALERAVSVGNVLVHLSSPSALADTTDLGTLISSLKQTRDALGRHHLRLDALVALYAPPLLKELRELETLVQTVAAGSRDHEVVRVRDLVLRGVVAPPDPADVAALEEIIAELEDLLFNSRLSQQKSNTLAIIQSPPVLDESRDLESLVDSMHSLQSRTERTGARMEVIEAMQQCPELQPVEDLKLLLEQLTALDAASAMVEMRRNSCDQAMTQKRGEIESLIEESGVCPLCGHPLDVIHFLEAVHA